MARKRVKKRTHVGANSEAAGAELNGRRPGAVDPKSMVIRIGAGELGSSLSQLASDLRRIMEPGTASRLKERRANRLRDYVTMCGPLGVTHLLLLSRSKAGNPNLRVALAPRGPTLHFRIEGYSLNKDIRRSQRRPKGSGKEYMAPPLLVMNNFTNPVSTADSNVPRHLESLITTVFQSLFPPINPQSTPLKSIKRVLLLNREPTASGDVDDGFILNLRHYVITTKNASGLSKASRRLDAAKKLLGTKHSNKGSLPNLGKLQDVADYMAGSIDGEGYLTDGTSGSEMDTDAEVEVLHATPKAMNARARASAIGQENGEDESTADRPEHVERLAVKLVDLGPRMRLRLTKVEEGLCSGKVMWHEYLHKSKDEIRLLDQKWERRKKEKELRRKMQKENVERKKAKTDKAHSESDGLGGDAGSGLGHDADLYSDMDEDDIDSEDLESEAEEDEDEDRMIEDRD